MANDVAIRVEGLGKRYCLGERSASYRTLRETIMGLGRALGRRRGRGDTIWALKDVSLEVRRGEVLGVIGHNGAGKTTLLKILSRITEPTTGRVELHGRVGSLLEVGTGFHPELTGRENIFLNGAILGMKRLEIERKFDEIVAFAEVERFLDTPVKHYSSGMYVRLAFAVAAHLEPEILLVDEVLAVGDAAFQKKCLGKLGEVARGGRTVLFVSHNLAMVEHLCTRGILLCKGSIARDGDVVEAIEVYMSAMDLPTTASLESRADRRGVGKVRFSGVELLDGELAPFPAAVSGAPLIVRLHYQYDHPQVLGCARFSLAVRRHGKLYFLTSTDMVSEDELMIRGRGFIDCRINTLPLSPGSYSLEIFCEAGGEIQDWVEDAACLFVGSGDFFGTGRHAPPGLEGQFVLVHHTWSPIETYGQPRP